MDTQTVAIIAGVVAVVVIILYVMDCKSKQESVDWSSAAKLASGAASIAGGIVFAVGSEGGVGGIVESAVGGAQDMFVGTPDF